MQISQKTLFFFSLSVFFVFVACSGSFNEETGEYKNRWKGFLIEFPEKWKKAESPPKSVISVVNPEETAQISVVVHKFPKEDMTLDQYLRQVLSVTTRSGGHIEKKGAVMLDGVDARWSIVALSLGGQHFTSINYYMVKGRRLYSIICNTESDKFTEYEELFKQVAQSFRLTT